MESVATLNLKETPANLTVTGTVVTYNAKDTVTLRPAVPQGINPAILILNVVVKLVPGPKKGTPKPFHYKRVRNAKKYTHVELVNGDNRLTIEVGVLG